MNDNEFYRLVEQVQRYISREYASLLDRPDSRALLENYIDHYLHTAAHLPQDVDVPDLRDRILQEMTGFSVLTPYLSRNDVEEINVNAWNSIIVTYRDGRKQAAESHFRDPQHAVDVLRRILRGSHEILDASKPIQVGHLPGNIRITAAAYDVVDEDKGVAVSIRKVYSDTLHKEDLLANGTATDEMLDLLAQCYTHGISICIAGATGSGKTTLLAWVLSQVPQKMRLITVEQGTREFDCTQRDDGGRVINNVVHLSTRLSRDAEQNIDQTRLLELIMTMDPDCIAVGESKGPEAMQAVEAANTGHAVITTTHANGCRDAYDRLLCLCKEAQSSMDDALLLRLAANAFPIVVYTRQLSDNSRKIMQIAEGTYDAATEDVVLRPLYRYAIDGTEHGPGGIEKVNGHFEKVGIPSERLWERLVEAGLPAKALERFFTIAGTGPAERHPHETEMKHIEIGGEKKSC